MRRGDFRVRTPSQEGLSVQIGRRGRGKPPRTFMGCIESTYDRRPSVFRTLIAVASNVSRIAGQHGSIAVRTCSWRRGIEIGSPRSRERCLEALGHEVVVADPNFAPMHAT